MYVIPGLLIGRQRGVLVNRESEGKAAPGLSAPKSKGA